MAGAAGALLVVMLDGLRASAVFTSCVQGRIFDADEGVPPCTWVGVTGPTDLTFKPEELYATVHIWGRTGEAEVNQLMSEAKRIFEYPPDIKGAVIVGWALDFTAVRRSEDDLAYHGLVRFRVLAQPE